jgi:uncharacterized membrane protein HdeD (DUF308 family)
MSTVETDVYDPGREAMRYWWLFLVAGFAWVAIAFIVLAVDADTPATIGILAGTVLLIAGVNELVQSGFVAGWRWLHVTLGVLFIITGILALMEPVQTFGMLALLIGWYLLFKGIVDITDSILDRAVAPLWGLLLGAGIAQVLIGVWAIGYPGRSAWLLVLWIGLAALARGITDIVVAFRVRGARPAYT